MQQQSYQVPHFVDIRLTAYDISDRLSSKPELLYAGHIKILHASHYVFDTKGLH